MKEKNCFFCGNKKVIVKDIIIMINDEEAEVGIGKRVSVCHVCYNQIFRCIDSLSDVDLKSTEIKIKKELLEGFKENA